ncbi:hypothetical protein SAMN02745130_01481 [Thiothrix eikelboomii]|uniref:Uncharacterized protein n=1 Tax=Thiothrix eikelboomii TaxID=92487 RepID=A0A1T4WET1_9GAMM|nr:hypothetical protein [Thiothrix eikelboomii]SKA75171.1 hypothetical protein SAMN02745130_01481 [Thiothrix eikelboomii]
MVDPSLLGIQLPTPNTQVTPQPLPSPEAADSTRFQDLLTNIGGQGGQIDSPSLRDQPVLQKINPTQTENTSGFTDAFVERVTGMDKSYHSIMDQLKNRPQLGSYMDELKSSHSGNLRTYPSVSGSADSQVTQLKDMMDSMRNGNMAMLNYERDVNTWAMNFQMWSSGVELASSIVSQLSRGFQTLFRASG